MTLRVPVDVYAALLAEAEEKDTDASTQAREVLNEHFGSKSVVED